MNRFKKEEAARFVESRKNSADGRGDPSSDTRLDRDCFEKAVFTLHIDVFPEEYDYMYDSNADAKDRDRGINPMRSEYVDRVRKRRKNLGIPELSANGIAANSDTEALCRRQVQWEAHPEDSSITCTLDAPQIASILHEIDPLGIGHGKTDDVGHPYDGVAREVRSSMDAGNSVTAALTGAMTSAVDPKVLLTKPVKRLLRHVHMLILR